jgi:hypothetical protein
VTLSLGFANPRDLLSKVERDLAGLESAIAAQDKRKINDSLYNFSVSVTSVKDWLKAHTPRTYTEADVEAYVASSVALSSFKDMANANKHREITRYAPSTREATLSSMPGYTWMPLRAKQQPFRIKIVRADGTRLEVGALAKAAVEEWRVFISRHGV